MITLYGHAMSRAHRNLWMLRELGVPFHHEPTDFLRGGNKTPEFLQINPNGKVPALADGDLVMFESLAINLYLARKFGGSIAPQNATEDALALQWTLWVVNEIEKTLFVACENLFFFPPADRRPEEAKLALEKIARPFEVMNKHLAEQDYLVANRFTVADLNAAAVMTLIPIAGVEISRWPHMSAWLARCLARPAADDYKIISFTVPRPKTEAAWMQSLM